MIPRKEKFVFVLDVKIYLEIRRGSLHVHIVNTRYYVIGSMMKIFSCAILGHFVSPEVMC
jgi:hypothetical protein